MAELAASIAAHEPLQSLVVRKSPRGKYAVIAGGRRLAALRALEAFGQIDSGLLVPWHVIAPEANGTELSLAENTMREDMHPADQFDAFRALADHGLPIADIAARRVKPARKGSMLSVPRCRTFSWPHQMWSIAGRAAISPAQFASLANA